MKFKIGDTLRAIEDWPVWPKVLVTHPVRILEGKKYKIKHITTKGTVIIDDETGSDMMLCEPELFN